MNIVKIAFYRFFMTGYLAVGFEFGTELTYPESEGTSSGILNAASQIFGIIFTIIYREVFNNNGDKKANLFLVGTLVIGTIFSALIPSNLKRQAAQQKETSIR